MIQLPDATCVIKVLGPKGELLPDGGVLFNWDPATIRFVIFNDSNKTLGPVTILGRLYTNGLITRPQGQSDVVPMQSLTLKPNEVWTREYVVTDSFGPSGAGYRAKLLADIGNFVSEELDGNNVVQRTFSKVPF